MRRTKMAALGMVMVLSMAACVGRAETTAEGATMKSMEMDSGESEENMIGMPNPYTDHDTLKEAEEDAGFKIQIPDEIRGVKAVAFRNLGTEMLEVIYYDGDAEVARVRKGTGAEDISGDYNVYEIEEAVDVTGTQVTLKGSADGYALAVWNESGYAYAVSVTKKITKDEILQIVEEIVKK